MSKKIATQWLQSRANTAIKHQLQEHLNLISKDVKLFGVPDHAVIDYTTWAAQCEHEFSQQVLTDIYYRNTLVTTANESNIRLTTYEYLSANDGSKHKNHLDIKLQLGEDNCWRVIEEHVISSKIIEPAKS